MGWTKDQRQKSRVVVPLDQRNGYALLICWRIMPWIPDLSTEFAVPIAAIQEDVLESGHRDPSLLSVARQQARFPDKCRPCQTPPSIIRAKMIVRIVALQRACVKTQGDDHSG